MTGALALCRFLQFGAAMLLWGGLAYGAGAPRLARALWAALLAAGLGWLLLETADAAGSWAAATDPGTLWALLAQTAVGRAWALHLALVAALGLALWAGRGQVLAAALALASLELVGHAAMDEGALGLLHRAVAALHLLAAGYWLGGLPLVLRALGRLEVAGEAAAVMRFSRRGHLAVALVLASGLGNTALVLGHLPDDPGSPYQALLAAKILAVLAILGLALANRYRFVPRLRGAGRAAALAALRRGTLAEIALGALALGLVSVFADLNPV